MCNEYSNNSYYVQYQQSSRILQFPCKSCPHINKRETKRIAERKNRNATICSKHRRRKKQNTIIKTTMSLAEVTTKDGYVSCQQHQHTIARR